jgi:hypothetical protein
MRRNCDWCDCEEDEGAMLTVSSVDSDTTGYFCSENCQNDFMTELVDVE